MTHHGKDVTLQLDSRWQAKLEASGRNHHLHLDPEIYIGAAHKKAKGKEAQNYYFWIGCKKNLNGLLMRNLVINNPVCTCNENINM